MVKLVYAKFKSLNYLSERLFQTRRGNKGEELIGHIDCFHTLLFRHNKSITTQNATVSELLPNPASRKGNGDEGNLGESLSSYLGR
jgi:hypothetical protein